jgi:tetratricopeptide (TPR) repeat protein
MADDARDPLIDAYYAARSASEADAAAWAARTATDPDDLVARASWLGWNMDRDLHGFVRSAEYGQQVVWLIANHPASELTGLVGAFTGGMERGLHEELRRLWTAAVEREPKNLAVLNHAAHFFGLTDPDKTHELLQAARALAPSDPLKEQSLATHWLLRSRRFTSTFDQAPFRFEDEFDAESARRALEHAERAIELTGPEHFNEWYEVTRIEAAAAAGSWARAEEVAKAVLARVGAGMTERVSGNVVCHANRILGHAAMRRGDLEAARGHLLGCCSGGSSLRFRSFDPDWSLARELLEHGERATVLEFLTQCRSLSSRDEDLLDLWELQIERGESCTFGNVRRRLKPPPAPQTGDADDRDPTEGAYVAGLHASEDEAQAWLERTKNQPENMWARAAWLGWAGRNQEVRGVLDKVQTQLDWLVQNRPEHPFTGGAAHIFTRFRNARLREHIHELWLEQTQRGDVRPAVLGNAASHCWSDDKPRALALLARAEETDPGNPKWPAQAAFVRLAAAHLNSEAIRFAERFDAKLCEDAWVDAERAYQLSKDADPDYMRLTTHMKAAAGAGRWERATEIAREALARIPGAPILRARRESCLNTAHMILGLAALTRDRRDEALSQLRESVACLSARTGSSNHPNALLALELLSLGERQAMLEFLDSARRLCPDEQAQIDLWQRHVREGRTPKLSFAWLHR